MSNIHDELIRIASPFSRRIADELSSEMKSRCGSKTIRDSIVVEKSGFVTWRVGIDGDSVRAKAGKDFSEAYVYGARPHRITPRSKSMLKFDGTNAFSGKTIFTKNVNHPGSPPHPFVEESVEAIMAKHPIAVKRK